VNLRITSAKQVGKRPVGGGAQALQHPGFGQQEGGGAHRRQHRAAPMLLAQPGAVGGKRRQCVFERKKKAGDEHQVGLRDLRDCAVHLQALPAPGHHCLAVQGGEHDFERRALGKLVGRAEHFHRQGGAGGRTLISQKQRDVHERNPIALFA
jgi:hypothetical protein